MSNEIAQVNLDNPIRVPPKGGRLDEEEKQEKVMKDKKREEEEKKNEDGDDRLIEVQVSEKTPTLKSQNLADNTLFIKFLTKQQSFVDKNALVGQWKSESNKKKDLKTLAAELAQKHTIKKSGNLTTATIQSRFQVTDLNELEEELKKNKKESSAEKKENEEKDSDFNPDEPEMLGDDEFTFSGNQNSRSKGKRALTVDDIRRLEEGGDDESEEDEEEGEEEEKVKERKRREKARREMGTYMEAEAELGSDNEGNDDFVK